MVNSKFLFSLLIFFLSLSSRNLYSQNSGIEYLRQGRNELNRAIGSSEAIIQHSNNAKKFFSTAVEFLHGSIVLRDSLKVAYTGIAESCRLLGFHQIENRNANYRRAIENCKYAIQIDSNYYWPYKVRGIVYFHQRKYDDARTDLEKVEKLNKLDFEARLYLAKTYYEKNIYIRAIQHLEELPSNDENVKLLIDSYLKNGNRILTGDKYKEVSATLKKIDDLIKRYTGVDKKHFEHDRDELKRKFIRKLVVTLEDDYTNTHLKNLLVEQLSDSTKGIILPYYKAVELLNQNKIKDAIIQLRIAEKYNSDDFRDLIAEKKKQYRDISKNLFWQAKERNKMENYDDAIANLKDAFKIDSSLVDSSFILSTRAKPEHYFELATLYLDYDTLKSDLTEKLYEFAQDSSKEKNTRHKSSFLIAVWLSRRNTKQQQKGAKARFDTILAKQPTFEPFYFKAGKDVQARKLFAQACRDEAKNVEHTWKNLQAYDTILENGKAQCDSILNIGEDKDVRILKEELITMMRIFKNYELYGIIIIIVIIMIVVVIGIFLLIFRNRYKSYFWDRDSYKDMIKKHLPDYKRENVKYYKFMDSLIPELESINCFVIYADKNPSDGNWNEELYIDENKAILYFKYLLMLYKYVNKDKRFEESGQDFVKIMNSEEVKNKLRVDSDSKKIKQKLNDISTEKYMTKEEYIKELKDKLGNDYNKYEEGINEAVEKIANYKIKRNSIDTLIDKNISVCHRNILKILEEQEYDSEEDISAAINNILENVREDDIDKKYKDHILKYIENKESLKQYELTEEDIRKLKEIGIPEIISSKMDGIKNKSFKTKDELKKNIEKRFTGNIQEIDKKLIINHAKRNVKYKLTEKIVEYLKDESIDRDILVKLDGIKNRDYITKKEFTDALKGAIIEEEWDSIPKDDKTLIYAYCEYKYFFIDSNIVENNKKLYILFSLENYFDGASPEEFKEAGYKLKERRFKIKKPIIESKKWLENEIIIEKNGGMQQIDGKRLIIYLPK